VARFFAQFSSPEDKVEKKQDIKTVCSVCPTAQPTEPAPAAKDKPKKPRRPQAKQARIAGIMLVAVGVVVAAYALTQPTKAAIGQMLLEDAWRQAQRGNKTDSKPWGWADMSPIAEIRFPSIGARFLVLDSASGEALAWAPGHVSGTAPLLQPGVSAIAAHRDTHFVGLDRLGPGAAIEVTVSSGDFRRYEIISGHIVDSRRFRFPDDIHGPDILALSTCWPIGGDYRQPERLIVFAAPVQEAGHP
jgi:sortase A